MLLKCRQDENWITPTGRKFTVFVTTNGEPGEIRTHDTRIKSPMLCQLSYRPILVSLNINSIYRISCLQENFVSYRKFPV